MYQTDLAVGGLLPDEAVVPKEHRVLRRPPGRPKIIIFQHKNLHFLLKNPHVVCIKTHRLNAFAPVVFVPKAVMLYCARAWSHCEIHQFLMHNSSFSMQNSSFSLTIRPAASGCWRAVSAPTRAYLQSETDLSIAGMYIHSRQHQTRTLGAP